VITTHRLPEQAFRSLASGGGDPDVIRCLLAAQLSKQIMLLHAIAKAAGDSDPMDPGVMAFTAAYKLLAEVQTARQDSFAWLLGLPHISAWAHDCLIRLNRGMPPDYGYLAAAASAAAVRAGIRFELDVPVHDHLVPLPGLGRFCVPDQVSWVRVDGDNEFLTVGAHVKAPRAAVVPDDGLVRRIPHWQGTALARVAADGHSWDVLLETSDRYLDRFTLAISPDLTPDEAVIWRRCVQSAWQILVRYHKWAAGPIAAGVSVIVPLTPRGGNALDSATTPAAFGAIATSPPPNPVILAETLVHEFQHLKLCGLMDMTPLIEPCDQMVYAAWRPDPRPAGGLLQGVYAHLGVARFWSIQRQVETKPDSVFRAQVTYERWRRTIEPSTRTLLGAGCLTTAGTRLVAALRDEGRSLAAEPVPADATAVADELALDHQLTWQLRHSATEDAAAAALAAAFQRGEPFGDQRLPDTRVDEETRKVVSTVRSGLLSLRYLDPGRYREVCDTGMRGPNDTADSHLMRGETPEAVRAYRDEIAATTEGQPEAWIGLALALHRLKQAPWQSLATHLPLIFDVHACLSRAGVSCDPLELAAWFT